MHGSTFQTSYLVMLSCKLIQRYPSKSMTRHQLHSRRMKMRALEVQGLLEMCEVLCHGCGSIWPRQASGKLNANYVEQPLNLKVSCPQSQCLSTLKARSIAWVLLAHFCRNLQWLQLTQVSCAGSKNCSSQRSCLTQVASTRLWQTT